MCLGPRGPGTEDNILSHVILHEITYSWEGSLSFPEAQVKLLLYLMVKFKLAIGHPCRMCP